MLATPKDSENGPHRLGGMSIVVHGFTVCVQGSRDSAVGILDRGKIWKLLRLLEFLG